VRRETPKASAASGKDRPPKYRSVTMLCLMWVEGDEAIDRLVQRQDLLRGLRRVVPVGQAAGAACSNVKPWKTGMAAPVNFSW
jgi:hypothetical protein